jgi:hypothetical protein
LSLANRNFSTCVVTSGVAKAETTEEVMILRARLLQQKYSRGYTILWIYRRV